MRPKEYKRSTTDKSSTLIRMLFSQISLKTWSALVSLKFALVVTILFLLFANSVSSLLEEDINAHGRKFKNIVPRRFLCDIAQQIVVSFQCANKHVSLQKTRTRAFKSPWITLDLKKRMHDSDLLKDGAYYCYCAYVLRILRYSDFLSVMLTNTGIFLRGLKLSGESRS